jgi:hypothetical protein
MATTQLPIDGVFDMETGQWLGLVACSGDEIPVAAAAMVSQPLSQAYSVTALDAGKRFHCTTALTVTVSPTSGSVIVFPPSSGSLTIAVSGGATLNGASASITRTFTANRLGVPIVRNPLTQGDFSVGGA